MQKNSLRQLVKALIAGAFISTLAACGGGGVSSSPPAGSSNTNNGGNNTPNVVPDNLPVIPDKLTSYTVGGTVRGLPAEGLPSQSTLKLSNGTDVITIEKNGSFTFPTAIGPGLSYEVGVKSNPSWTACTVNNPRGSSVFNVTNIDVACVDAEKGKVTTLEKDSQLIAPRRIAVSSSGDYYLIVQNNVLIRYYTDAQGVLKYDPDFLTTKLFGRTSLVEVSDVAVDSKDNVYLALNTEAKIAKLTPDGNGGYTADENWAQNPSLPPGSTATSDPANDFLYKPQALAIDPTDDGLYVMNNATYPSELASEYTMVKIKTTNPTGGPKTQADVEKNESIPFYNFYPGQMKVNAQGDLFISDRTAYWIRVIRKADSIKTAKDIFSTPLPLSDGIGQLKSSRDLDYYGLAFDKAGNMFLSAGTQLYMVKFDSTGKPIKGIKLAGISAPIDPNNPWRSQI